MTIIIKKLTFTEGGVDSKYKTALAMSIGCKTQLLISLTKLEFCNCEASNMSERTAPGLILYKSNKRKYLSMKSAG